MSEIDSSGDKMQSGDDFKDPLGVTGAGLDSPTDSSEYEVLTPSREVDIDAAIAEVKEEMETLRLAAASAGELEEEDTKDLFVVVDNPEKHGGAMGTYITFRIITKTTRTVFDNCEYQVRRRYNDFVWLRQRLEETQPAHLVPPLPEKHSMNMDRFNPDFVKKRMSGLQTFLQRIADHPVLSFNKYYQSFLTATQWEFQAAKKEGSGLITRVADSFHNMSAAYMMKNRPQEFTAMQEYIQVFGDKLGVLERISDRIWKEQYAYLNDLNEWGPIFTLWSNSEDKLRNGLVAMAKSIEKCFVALQDMYDSTEQEFHQPLREYQLYSEAIKAVLRRRDGIQMEYEMVLEELNRKKDERDQQTPGDENPQTKVTVSEAPTSGSVSFGSLMGKSAEEQRQQKLTALDDRVSRLSKKVEELNDRAVCADTDLKADMERWHKTKKRDFKHVFVSMADRQIKFYEQCLAAWEEAIPQIQKSDQQQLDAESLDRISAGSAGSEINTHEEIVP